MPHTINCIEAITVCTSLAATKPSYDDFLDVVARENRGLFERWIVVTSPWDRATQECARKWNLELLITEDGCENGQFNKGRMIARAQRLCRVDAWRLHLDVDIALPTTFRNSLDSADLDPKKIYGWDRVMVKGWQKWLDLKNSGYLSHQTDYHCRVIFPKGVEVGSRWATPKNGACPIGYSQLWNAQADEFISFQHRAYPENHGAASRTDTQHPLQWDRRQRELLPEIICVHLESEEDQKMGVNWNGRVTKRFGPEVDAKEPVPGGSC